MTDAATARSVTIRIPGTPAYSLSPNARCHWAVKRKETEAAGWAVKKAVAGSTCPMLIGPVRLHWTVYLPKGGKKRDMTNILPCLKAHEDYLVRFGVLAGDSPKHIPETPTVEQIVWSKHRGQPHIDVTITEAVQQRQEGR
jgi:hypothetical protein